MAAISKREADAYDRMIEAAAALADLLESNGITMDEYDLEELTIFLARNARSVEACLKPIKSNACQSTLFAG
ncbi:MAG: YebG family protein [Desulfatitalea sp.]|nr:YebG family protein [Desulfatitalea sp.]